MRFEGIVPARIVFDDGVPFAPDFGDVYHARAGALEQARHVFLGGNQLPVRWRARERFVVLETGFGLGNNFLATWAAWRDDPQRCSRLSFISIEKHPPVRNDLSRALSTSPLPELAAQLVDAWPPPAPNLHRLAFEFGRVELLLALGDVSSWLPEIVADVDAFYLDGFAPARNPEMWNRRVLKALGRLAAPGATAATWSVAREVRDSLAEVGFAVQRAPGFSGKREMTVARYAPTFVPRRPPSRLAAASRAREAIVIGAGLAGASVAKALASRGVQCTVVDRHPVPAAEASGNPAGLFHGIVTPHDGAHARFNRSAAMHAEREYKALVASGQVSGSTQGMLRIDETPFARLEAIAQGLGLPQAYVRAVDANSAHTMADTGLAGGGWFYPGGGWLSPEALVRHWLQQPGIRVLTGIEVASVQRVAEAWRLLDAFGRVILEARLLILAPGVGFGRLLPAATDWPLNSVRGQLTLVPKGMLPIPRLPLAGAGYAIPLPDGRLLFGATSQPGDTWPDPRAADHEQNLRQLARLLATDVSVDAGALEGRVGMRLVADDRLPVLGPVPIESPSGRLDQARFVARQPGLFVLAALGSRGITWAPLTGEIVAAWIEGAPLPIEASLLDAIDVARFIVRQARKPS
ncbi:MAG TPA: bifunctional tRNA (5-methylaminomethyl-2-thiouridine)(34)-methyltransferase MnmD/FAD-dependent 5-carboxymethylaminomethyl-2-thiouridine(34) oxidoreductase MnmC [Burkholderiaceae bacterium]|nr:bifunctional tRNA (5-methylaminomethyl-2-thiouridine)(34)-methyltransferase MnmD/FAD-dependent 5-carboxymethylaminomethyl-2-thiouridine(34) oxidoreductase MnmC [Burkholderiaceae bacterium]